MKGYLKYCSNLDNEEYNSLWECYHEYQIGSKKTQLYNVCIILMEDKYEGLSDEELKEIFEDMEADYWIDYYKSVYE